MIFIADIPVPPSANSLFTHYLGRRIISRPYKAWRQTAGRALLEQWNAQDRPLISKPWQLYIRLNVNHTRDVDNAAKPIADLLVATIPEFPDDSWCDRLVVERDRTVAEAWIEAVTL